MGRGDSCYQIRENAVEARVPTMVPNAGRQGESRLPGDLLLARSPFFSGLAGNSGSSGFIGKQGADLERVAPKFTFLGFTPEDGAVSEIHLEETIGFELPMVRATLTNIDKRFNSTELAREQTPFSFTMGYENPGMETFGPFIVQRPKFKHTGPDKPKQIEILGYGEAVKLGATERREIYKKMKDSDIAEKIAGRYGFQTDIEKTDQVHEQVIQANESDYKFLARRAKMYGYLLYVDKGILHFHRVRPRTSEYRLTYAVTPDQRTGPEYLENFIVRSRTFMRGLKLKMTQFDPITKEEIDLTSTEEKDPVQGALDVGNWKELVTPLGMEQPERFITNEGHEQQRPLLQTQIDRMAQSTRYVISGWGNAIGLERLRANDVITIDGVGKHSGKYFVVKTVHDLVPNGGGYRMWFEVVRCGTRFEPEPNTPVPTIQESVVRI